MRLVQQWVRCCCCYRAGTGADSLVGPAGAKAEYLLPADLALVDSLIQRCAAYASVLCCHTACCRCCRTPLCSSVRPRRLRS